MNHFFSKIGDNCKLLFTRSSSLSKKEFRKKKKVRNRAIGYTLVSLQIILAIIFLWMLLTLNIIPNKYMLMLFIVLLLVTIYNIASQFTKAHIIGKSLAVAMSIILLIGSIYITKTNSMLNKISGTSVKTDYFSVIVLKTDVATTLSEAKYYPFGYHSSIDHANSEKVVTKINDEIKTELKTSTYSDWDSLVKALYNQNVKAIIVNESNRDDIESKFTDFDEKTKVLQVIKLESQITKTTKNVITKPFTVYIAGTDSYDNNDPSTGKNDVNIIATFNPETRQIMLVTTPRDYYIKIYTNSEKGVKIDKLTHAGTFGIDSSMNTLSNLYGIDFDYYVRINFTGTVDIVDALGGIDINSEVAFSTTADTAPVTYHFTVGNNANCNGEKTLAFCRERMAFALGDNQRGRDQMFAIQGIIAKATSPAILTNYASVMDSVSGMFVTSMPHETITTLIKDMLNNSTPWNVQTYNVTGSDLKGVPSNLYPNDPTLQKMDTTAPDYDSIHTAIELMSKVKNGEIFNVNEYLESATAGTKNGK